jgi:hypothetical protein
VLENEYERSGVCESEYHRKSDEVCGEYDRKNDDVFESEYLRRE